MIDLKTLDIPDEFFSVRRACFVSLHKSKNDELRGCIGTLEPQEKNLAEEIQRNAISAAFHDRRFQPLTTDELEEIDVSVDVLTIPERIYSADELDPSIFGLIITDGKFRRGVLLPSIPGIDTPEQQVLIVKRKADLSEADEKKLEYYRFTSNRFQ